MTRPARVAFLIWSLDGGGAERQLVTLVHNLDRSRFEPHVIVRHTASAYGDLDAPVHSLDAPGAWTPAVVARLVRVLRALRPDLLHTEMDPENMWGRLAARAVGVRRVVCAVRCPELPVETRISERLSSALVDEYVVNSVGIRDALRDRCGVRAARVTVIENGVDLQRFSPVDGAARASLRAQRGVEDRIWVLLPGRISPEKNQLLVARAMANLARTGRLPPALRVTFAGADGLDAAYVRAVDAALREPGVLGAVERSGFMRDIAAAMSAADAVMLPSSYEGISNALIEAMVMGTPAAVCDGANRDGVIRDGVEGWCIGAPGERAIESCLLRIADADAETRRAMGATGRREALTRFHHARMVNEQQEVYERLLQRR